MVTFTEEILNGKPHFLCSECVFNFPLLFYCCALVTLNLCRNFYNFGSSMFWNLSPAEVSLRDSTFDLDKVFLEQTLSALFVSHKQVWQWIFKHLWEVHFLQNFRLWKFKKIWFSNNFWKSFLKSFICLWFDLQGLFI